MAQSVKLKDNSYIDASAVYDTSLGMTQEAANAVRTGTLTAESGFDLQNCNYKIVGNVGIISISFDCTISMAGWKNYPIATISPASKLLVFGLVQAQNNGNTHAVFVSGDKLILNPHGNASDNGWMFGQIVFPIA